MNERTTFLEAAAGAGLCASIFPCVVYSSSALCVGSSGLLNYAGEHFFLSIALWVPVFGAAWLVMGSRLVRPRQNLSTKLRLLAWAGVAGILIDTAVSIYQFENSLQADLSRAPLSALIPDLAGRGMLYAIAFAAVVGVAVLISSRRKPTVTPPPRFGRE